MAASLSDILRFDSEVTNVVKIDDSSLVLCQASEVMICSPFQANRGLSGMHCSFYKGGNIIIGACSILLDATLALEALEFNPSDYPTLLGHNDTGLLLLDAGDRFVVLDIVRLMEVSVFATKDVTGKEEILDFCGSRERCQEISILTNHRALVIHVGLDEFEVLHQVPVAATSISPYADGYLLNCVDGLRFHRDGNLATFHELEGGSEVRVSGEFVVVATPKRDPQRASWRKIKIVGGRSFGLKGMISELWDVAGGHVIAVHANNTITVTSLEETQKKGVCVHLTHHVDHLLSLSAAVDRSQSQLCIVLIGKHEGLTVHIPLSKLNSMEKGEGRSET
jgi:hypothetical protein